MKAENCCTSLPNNCVKGIVAAHQIYNQLSKVSYCDERCIHFDQLIRFFSVN